MTYNLAKDWDIETVINNCAQIHHNGIRKIGKRHGISIGHKDTENIIEGNYIIENAISGIYFRKKTEANGVHKNKIIFNLIENNGLSGHTGKGYGIYINGITHDITIQNNTIRDIRTGDSGLQKIGIYLLPGVSDVNLVDNMLEKHQDGNIVDYSSQ